MPNEEFEILSDSALVELVPTKRSYIKAPMTDEFEILEDIDGLIDKQLSESIFDVVPPDFDFSTLPREYINSRDEKRKSVNRPVIFIDGEGANFGDRSVTLRRQYLKRWVQKQNYALLGAVLEPDEYRCIVGKNNTEQLTTKECLEFILSLPATHIIVGFALTYDVEMWLRGVSDKSSNPEKPSLMERLMKYQSVWFHGYRLHYIPKKIFTVTKYKGTKKLASRTIYDSFGFFQSDFKTAIRSWHVGTEEEWKFIDRMKDTRSTFGPITEEVKTYNRMEGVHGIQLFQRVRAEYTKLELRVPRPVGAGSIASAMFRKHDVLQYYPKYDLLPTEIMLSAFIGGRFDLSRVGFVGNVFEYDINSAYPHIARNLPCLRCGQYVVARHYEPEPHSLWLVRWKNNGTRWSPFPYRTDNGNIRYYENGVGWYYDAEVASALLHDSSIEVIGGYRFERNCNHRPFQFLEDYYYRRQELKIAHDFGEKILKLGCNSVYGKLAQSKGKHPPFQQLIWAGLITSGTRAMLIQGIQQNPDAIVKVATDALFSTVPLQLPLDELVLGCWKTEILEDLLVLGNGVYQSTNGVAKNRGFERDAKLRFDWDIIRENYRNGVLSVVSKYEFRRFVKAFHERKLEERCDWIESEIELKLDIQKMKRIEGEYIYPLPNPTPNVISAPARIRPENLRHASLNHSVSNGEVVNE
jgi:hypothetical protein